ncbi:NADH-ubiquinone oxidoreductase 9.5 kDa subunit [Pseudovirgaria hyperparasitica]|uniref:NADH-ubiquinone oxidoreductase 9.5 kDa subunit n=1 Tax=Pseudovirgaria hyperparasitica TaxID=470096 RepID=A0A6A6W7S5_9PEZI|nr:NADH-ubiquinone oxidoreductase 9.5 kDa subunit [Pseudovirgaria hyperparasitica]KAF2758948.1 NADH-ubiquinone oxidoreductase 9.5 kDa subunit [Pseudovirgaria hyperparasitica]
MSAAPHFFSTPFRYIRYASHQYPAYFWSIVVGVAGPASFFYAPPIRRAFGDNINPKPIPLTYPVPKGPRNIPTGFDDE